MSNREMALALLEKVPENKLGYVIAFMQGLIAGEIADEHRRRETDQHCED